ncbi:MAG: hypothetical protein M3198_09130, partial [Actinomycetota bacterium]|nr:hypothetical protein [Actinomycetota bacterium]
RRHLTAAAEVAVLVIAVALVVLAFNVSGHIHRQHVEQDCGAVAADAQGHEELEVFKACIRERR